MKTFTIPEGFKPLKENPKYFINEEGRVLSTYKNRELKHHDNNGYKMIFLKTAEKDKWHYIHRLVANNFIINPEGKPEVNHMDGDKANNHVLNLEWAAKSENHQHARKMGLIKPSRHRLGVKVSEGTRKKQSEAKQGEKHPKFTGYYITPFGKFTSTYKAAEADPKNINPKRIGKLCKSNLYIGYSFEAVK